MREAGTAGSGAGLTMTAAGSVAGVAGSLTGDVPLAGGGVIIAEKGEQIALRGEATIGVGTLLSALGGDYSGGSDLVLGKIINGENVAKLPVINSLPSSWKKGIRSLVGAGTFGLGQSLDKTAEKYLGCKEKD